MFNTELALNIERSQLLFTFFPRLSAIKNTMAIATQKIAFNQFRVWKASTKATPKKKKEHSKICAKPDSFL